MNILTKASVLLLAGWSVAGDWHQWRGEHRDGLSDVLKLPQELPEKLTKIWQIEVGEGHAAPVVSGDKVVVLTRVGEHEVVSCRKLADGSLLWQDQYPAMFAMNTYALGHGKGPKATPAIEGNRLYTMGITGVLSCYELNSGKRLWQQTYFKSELSDKNEYICIKCGQDCDGEVYDKPGTCPVCPMQLSRKGQDTAGLFYGIANSPLVVDGQVVVQVGNAERGAVVAYHASTGKELWARKGPGPGYASPNLYRLDGRDQIITYTRRSALGLDPKTGTTLWEVEAPDMYNENVAQPVVVAGLVILSGPRAPTRALRIKGNKAEEVWKNETAYLFMSSPVVVGQHLYGMSWRKKGQFFCMDATTGNITWTSEGRQGENAALIATGKHLLAATTTGQLIIMAKNPQTLNQVASYPIAETPVWAHPAPIRGGLLVKDKTHLIRWQF